MAWNKVVEKVATAPRTSETLWTSSYPNSLERWTKDFESAGYKLVAEYALDDNKILYRFENANVYHSVVIKSIA